MLKTCTFCSGLAAAAVWLASCLPGNGDSGRLPFNPETLPDRPEGDRSFRFVAISDLNGPYGSTTYNEHVHSLVRLTIDQVRPELVVSAGDLVAGQRRGLENEQVWAMWDGFTSAVTAPLKEAGIPFAPVAGNHDASGYPAFAHEREIYQAHWRKPEQRPDLEFIDDTHYPLYYSFHHKDAFFLVMDITTLDPLPETLWTWIEAQLTEAQDYALRFATCHIPPYPVSHGREREIIPAPDNDRLRELFVQKNVDVFFTGHHHAYFKGRKEGLNLVSLNCAGSGPRPVIGTEHPQHQSMVVVDVVDGQIEQIFALKSDEVIFEDRTLPLRLEHGPYVLPRFDQD
jgi:acid phosphatase type 7